ncbi:LytR C-terminal domain-containing protein [bacterium]|nr:LytR C-terminal domain-containing protein [bacterium]
MPVRMNSINRHNVKKKSFVISPKILRFFGFLMKFGIGGAVAYFIVTTGWNFFYRQITESYKPNAGLFEQCSESFIAIKAKPVYGVVIVKKGTAIEGIYLTAPTQNGIKAIALEARDWVNVYFSDNFTYTQVGEFLRLSKLERGNFDYCYILEQLSLTSGVPIEYVVVDDKEEGLSSSMSLAQTQLILSALDQRQPVTFNRNLLPIQELDDGSHVSVTVFDSFKEQFPNFFKIDEISQEQAFVEVYNATAIDGYASIFSRKWSMLGIDISRIGNATHEPIGDATAIVYVKDEQKYVRTVAMIKSSFPEGKVAVKQGRPTSLVTTGDIVVFLLKR